MLTRLLILAAVLSSPGCANSTASATSSPIVLDGDVLVTGSLSVGGNISWGAESDIPYHGASFSSPPAVTVIARSVNGLTIQPCYGLLPISLPTGSRINRLRVLVHPVGGVATLRAVVLRADLVTGGTWEELVTPPSMGGDVQMLMAKGAVDVVDDSVYTVFVEDVAATGGRCRLIGAEVSHFRPQG